MNNVIDKNKPKSSTLKGIWICYFPKIMQFIWIKIVLVLKFQSSKPKLWNSNGLNQTY